MCILNMHQPIVSIGMPVYNGADYILRSISSIQNQDYGDFELLISDNASTDATEDICKDLSRKDQRIQYVKNSENIGAARNYNRVFDLAKGKYFKWAAHDDECHPAFLRRCVDSLEQSPDSVVMVYPLGELIDEEGRTIVPVLDRIASSDPRPHRRLAHLLWSLNMCDPVFGLIKAEYLRRTQLIGPFFGADYVLLGELAMLGQIRELDHVLFRLRAHARRSMAANPSARERAAWYDPEAMRKRFVIPNWERMVIELMKSVGNSPLSAQEKMKCMAVVPGMHYWRRFRNTGGRVKARVKRILSGILE